MSHDPAIGQEWKEMSAGEHGVTCDCPPWSPCPPVPTVEQLVPAARPAALES